MYSKSHNIVIGFHGCDKKIRDAIVNGEPMKPSNNDYDWLGKGFYFWENNKARAEEFAREKKTRDDKNAKHTIEDPSALGAVIDLGKCLDLTNSEYLSYLKKSYNDLEHIYHAAKIPIPNNKKVADGNTFDLMLRNLDCAVIEILHLLRERAHKDAFDSVRGVFWEGDDLYPNAGFKEKNHIQICVRNVNCIKGFFIPRKADDNFLIP
jgi:hypothetical protein